MAYLGGKAEIAIGTTTIDPEFLEELSVNITEGTRETTSLAGTIRKPSGTIETAEVTGTFILPSMDALKQLWANAYEGASGTGTSGRVVFGDNSCTTVDPVVVNIHYTCEEDSNNDVHLYACNVQMNFNPTYNASDNLTVEFTILAQPTANGYGFAGAGDTTKRTLWNAATQTFEEVES